MAKVLVIEDDKIIAAVIEKFLTNGGHKVTVAHNGKVGLRAAAGDPPDVVITDLYMPETDGLQAIRELHAQRPDLPIIAVSGGGSGMDLLGMARMLGAREVLSKPLFEKSLLGAVERCLAGPAPPG